MFYFKVIQIIAQLHKDDDALLLIQLAREFGLDVLPIIFWTLPK
jgi:hypothetical protein